MAIQEKKQCTIHYRKFQRPNGLQISLEQAIRNAMNSSASGALLKDRYLLRCLNVNDDSYFINFYKDVHDGESYVFGDLIHFTHGHKQALFATGNQNAATVQVDQMPAPQAKEFVHSQMFWLIKGDHVFVIQSLSLNNKDLEDYLGWFCISQAKVLPLGTPIILAFAFDTSALNGDLSKIKKISIGGSLSKSAHTPDSSDVQSNIPDQHQGTREQQISAGNNISADRGVIRRIFDAMFDGNSVKVDEVLNELPKNADLKINVSIGFDTSLRKFNRKALQDITVGLRNLPEADMQVQTADSKISPDGKVRLSQPCRIKMIKQSISGQEVLGSLLDPSDVLHWMWQTYSSFKASGRIS